MTLPPAFTLMMRSLLKDEADDFFVAMSRPPVVSVRLNSRKPGAEFPEGAPVKWCPTGFYLPERPQFTLDPLLHAGAYYVQDASSMIHYEVVGRILRVLSDACGKTDGAVPLSVLDLCAAPGGKTTAMIDALPDGSRVVANEYVAKRAAVLRENLTKWGFPGVVVSNSDSSRFAENADCFDIVAVDAPCSGEGMMRKDSDAVSQWSPELVGKCASLQREILANAVGALKPGGFLIYSTCTFNTVENEDNARFIRDELGLEPFDPEFPDAWGIPGGIGTSMPVFRFMPHKTEGEGLFLAIFRKPGEFVPTSIPSAAPARSRTQSPGKPERSDRGGRTDRGRTKSRKQPEAAPEVPPMEEILSVDFRRDAYPLAELTLQQALAYLRRESVVLAPDVPKGIVVVTYKGLPLGPAKNIGSRANNLYPKSWRILMR